MRNFAAFPLLLLLGSSVALAQSPDKHLLICEQADHSCQETQKEFKAFFPRALAGEREAQRNVSSCLTNGCEDAVQRDRVLGCAWRLMIIKSAASESKNIDEDYFSANCTGSLTDADVAHLESQAGGLFRTVYKKPMP
ncbi:hypothetical protein [Methylobacterium oxalidis]|uniref:hypothetical protein n=1 Tax=Methylobacterium oxalidis TaxID=944322 RepID=UPI003315FC8A